MRNLYVVPLVNPATVCVVSKDAKVVDGSGKNPMYGVTT
jgi:hypothetical protein